MLQCGRKHVYQLIAEGHLVSFKDGRSRKITVASIEAYIAHCLTASAGSKLKRPA
jgi:excisionase family DNA binding protein